MRYVSHIMPEKSKVLPEYFKGDLYKAAKKNPWRRALLWISGIPFLLAAVVSVNHPWLTILYGIIGFILIPPGHRFIERKLRFRLTAKIKTVACAVFFVLSLPISIYYANLEHQIVHQQSLMDERAAKDKAMAERKESLRKDSLDHYLRQSRQFSSQHKMDEAHAQLQRALAFAGAGSDRDLIEKEKVNIVAVQVKDWVKSGNYKKALPEINILLHSDPSNPELQYSQALCYSKIGNIKEAVAALKPLIQSGNREAEKLHDKINPIRKRVAGTETLCCDGSTSNATGRGACSHHGGVCDWNHPIYEEYRKYEKP